MTKTKQGYKYNFKVAGSPIITSQGIASGFSASNYLTLGTFNPSSNSWEVAVKFTTSDNLSTEQMVFNNLVSYCGAAIYVKGGKLWTQFTGSTSSINIGSHTLNGILQNKTYWVKIIHDSTQTKYTSSYSEDGQTWVEFGSTTSSNTITGGTGCIGIEHDGAGAFQGSIDLTECYININGQRWWDALTAATFYGDTYQVRKGLPYQVRVRADGKWDFTGNQTFTTAGQEYFATMETYDGLSETYIESYQSADKVDFSNTVLPWKWQYSTALSTNRYCLMPQGQNYENVTQETADGNFNVIGSPTFDYVNQTVAGFSTDNYLTLKDTFRPGNSTWEMVFKVKCPYSGGGMIFGKVVNDSGYYGLWLSYNTIDKKMEYYASYQNSSSSLFYTQGTNTLPDDEWIYVKFEFTGSAYNGYLSTDGISWTPDMTYSSSTKLYDFNATTCIGQRINSPYPLINGEIDLSESYIKVNGADLWVPEFTKGAKTTTITNYNVAGSPTISNYVATNFSSSNYLTKAQRFDLSKPWEFNVHVKTPSSIGNNFIYSGSGTDATGARNMGFWLRVSSDIGSAFQMVSDVATITGNTISTSTEYWLKVGWTGTEYYGKISTDGISYNDFGTRVESTTSMQITGDYFVLGSLRWFNAPFNNGSIYLEDTYMIVDDIEVWRAVTHPEVKETLPGCTYNFTDDGSATTLNCFAVNGDESIILTPNNSYGTSRLLGTVSIPAHTVYEYDNGTWSES